MSDRITLKGVSATGFHGVLDVEKRDGQSFVVDVEMDVDLTQAGTSDDLVDTVNYAEVATDVVALIEGESLDLIEALADRIAAKVLTRPLVDVRLVTVHSPTLRSHPFTDVAGDRRTARETPCRHRDRLQHGRALETIRNAVRACGSHVELKAGVPGLRDRPVGGRPSRPTQRRGRRHDADVDTAECCGRWDSSSTRPRPQGALWTPHARPRLIQYGTLVFDTDCPLDRGPDAAPSARAPAGVRSRPVADADAEATLRVDARCAASPSCSPKSDERSRFSGRTSTCWRTGGEGRGVGPGVALLVALAVGGASCCCGN